MTYKYNYFYKITNLINGKYYYGIHSTNNLEDGYMGSGTLLHKAYKKYGIENFNKEILKYFDTRKELCEYEEEVVNEVVIKDLESYNIKIGGENFCTLYTISVKDKDGNYFRCKPDDPKYLSREYIPNCKNLSFVRDKLTDKLRWIDKDEYNLNKDKYIPFSTDTIRVIDNIDNKEKFISIDEFYCNKDRYISWSKNKILVKENNKYFMIDKNDKRIISGELKQMWFGKKHNKESINKMKTTMKNINHQKGEKNSQYGTCWIHNNEKSIKIKKEKLEEYLLNGWIKGRKIKF